MRENFKLLELNQTSKRREVNLTNRRLGSDIWDNSKIFTMKKAKKKV